MTTLAVTSPIRFLPSFPLRSHRLEAPLPPIPAIRNAVDSRGRMHGFQLWANLPANLKMTDPRYQDIPASAIPEITDDDETRVRVICVEFWGKRVYLRSLSR